MFVEVKVEKSESATDPVVRRCMSSKRLLSTWRRYGVLFQCLTSPRVHFAEYTPEFLCVEFEYLSPQNILRSWRRSELELSFSLLSQKGSLSLFYLLENRQLSTVKIHNCVYVREWRKRESIVHPVKDLQGLFPSPSTLKPKPRHLHRRAKPSPMLSNFLRNRFRRLAYYRSFQGSPPSVECPNLIGANARSRVG